MIAAARAAGADAVHPGYGFSENADFAAAVLDAGLTWIGPPVRGRGDGLEDRGQEDDGRGRRAGARRTRPDTVTADQLPVLIKASAGGGGRGMRVVRELSELPTKWRPRREAQSAFGDPTVFCERYLATGHHVEVQVLADEHGTVWAVGERECSIQRRHQKIIEEARRLSSNALGHARQAVRRGAAGARAIGYTGAGTVEFMADDNGDFFFLEMNTRLQVEHPGHRGHHRPRPRRAATACRRRRPPRPEPPPSRGYSIEARLYAEDPAKGWQPQAGAVHQFGMPGQVRVDTGIVDGSEVSVFYDPMLAKIISYAPTRRQAATVLADALARTRIHGVRTNRDLLVNVLRHPAFLDGATDTAFFDTHGLAELAAPLADPQPSTLSALAAALADAAGNRRSATVFAAAPSGWRNLTRASSPSSAATARARTPGSATVHPHRRGVARLRRVSLVSATPTRWCWPSTAWTARSTSPATATTCSSTPRSARATRRAAALPRSGRRGRTARCWRPCRVRCSASAPRSATPSPRASR